VTVRCQGQLGFLCGRMSVCPHRPPDASLMSVPQSPSHGPDPQLARVSLNVVRKQHRTGCCRLAETQAQLQAEAAAAAQAKPLPLPLVTASRGGGPWFAALMQQWQAAGIPPLGMPFAPGLAPVRFPTTMQAFDPMAAWYSQRGAPPPVISSAVQGTHSPAPFPQQPAMNRPAYGWWGGAPPNPYAAAFAPPAFPAQLPAWQHAASVAAPPHAWASAQPGLDAVEETKSPAMPMQAAVVVTGANFDPEPALEPEDPADDAVVPASGNDTPVSGHSDRIARPELDAGHAHERQAGTVNDAAVAAAEPTNPHKRGASQLTAQPDVRVKRQCVEDCRQDSLGMQETGAALKQCRRN